MNFIEKDFPHDPTLHFADCPGNPLPLVLLHGLSRRWQDWQTLIPEFSTHRRVVALDHRGHGESGRAHSYKVVDYAHDAVDFVAATFDSPVILFGHSLGAMCALSVAARTPKQVAAIVMEDPPFHTMGRRMAHTMYPAQFTGMRAAARNAGDLETIIQALGDIRLPTTTGDEVRLGDLRDEAGLRFSAECLQRIDPEVFTPVIEGRWLDGFDERELFHQVACPVLILQADPAAGGMLTAEDAGIAHELMERCHCVRFTGVGHLIHQQRPKEVVRLFQEFLRDHQLGPIP